MFDTWPDEVAFSPDGGRLLISSWGSHSATAVSDRVTFRVFGMCRAGPRLQSFVGHRSDTRGGTFSHDGRLIATVSMDGTARLWDGITGELRGVLGDETPRIEDYGLLE